MIPGVVANQITTVPPAPAWLGVASTAYNGTVSLNAGSTNANVVTLLLTENHPPDLYETDYIMRVRIYSLDGFSLLGTTYRIRGFK